MYTIGEKIVYPMHGAGVIEKIEDKKILGQTRQYYILHVPCGDIKIMCPVDATEEIGVRAIITKDELQQVLTVLKSDTSEMSGNWNRRYRENMEKLKTGNVMDVAEVVRNLMRTDREKKLSAGEKKMLSNARQILLSELILVGDLDEGSANTLINDAV